MESVYRLLKALEQRGDFLILETEKEIYIDRPKPSSQGILRITTAG
jgi:hypothetical protein